MTDTTPLFSPFTLNNGVEIRNRLVVTPMTHYASNPDGTLSDEEQAFLTGRADDFGIFITAATLVHPSGKAFVGQPCAYDESHLASLTKIASIISKAVQNQFYKFIMAVISRLPSLARSSLHLPWMMAHNPPEP